MKYFNKLYSEFEHLDNTTTKSLHSLYKTENTGYHCIAARMNVQLEYIYTQDSKWLDNKIRNLLNSNPNEIKPENFNGLMGEVRAYGDLLEIASKVQEISSIETPNSGSDFLIKFMERSICIEVNSPQHSGSKTTSKDCYEYQSEYDNFTMNINVSSTAPYGYPTEKKYNIQYEAVSKFAQIKKNKEGKQFKNENISILWLDLNNPVLDPFNQLEYTVPILSFNGKITSGFLWNAFYSLKGDNIYEDYDNCTGHMINMQFNGRFADSNIDFVIIDCFTHKVIFENHNSTKSIPIKLFATFFQLYNLNTSNSLLSYNEKSELKKLVDIQRTLSNNLTNLY